jgi:hypothetical protein
MPVAGVVGVSNVARSITVSESKTVMSALGAGSEDAAAAEAETSRR